MTLRRLIVLSILPFLGLSACGGQYSETAVTAYTSGSHLYDLPSFGAATARNQLVMTDADFLALEMTTRFANEVETTVNFPYNSAQLTDQAKATLRSQAAWMARHPELTFQVFGHTDSTGSAAYNKALGKKRALAVLKFLNAAGISRSRLSTAVSKGETQPLIVSLGREVANRRTVTEVSGIRRRGSQVLDGRYAASVYNKYANRSQSQSGASSVGAASAAVGESTSSAASGAVN